MKICGVVNCSQVFGRNDSLLTRKRHKVQTRDSATWRVSWDTGACQNNEKAKIVAKFYKAMFLNSLLKLPELCIFKSKMSGK